MIYTLGFLLILAARIVYAGMKQKELFYKEAGDYEVRRRGVKKGELILDGDKILKYVMFSLPLVLLWPIAIPAIGLFMLGQKYGK